MDYNYGSYYDRHAYVYKDASIPNERGGLTVGFNFKFFACIEGLKVLLTIRSQIDFQARGGRFRNLHSKILVGRV